MLALRASGPELESPALTLKARHGCVCPFPSIGLGAEGRDRKIPSAHQSTGIAKTVSFSVPRDPLTPRLRKEGRKAATVPLWPEHAGTCTYTAQCVYLNTRTHVTPLFP